MIAVDISRRKKRASDSKDLKTSDIEVTRSAIGIVSRRVAVNPIGIDALS